MFKIIRVLSDIRDAFSNQYEWCRSQRGKQSIIFVACSADLVFKSYEIPFFCFLRISISLMILMLTYALFHFFTVHIFLGCRKCLIRMLFDRKSEKLLSQTLYRTRDAAHVILNVYAKKMP